MHPLFQRHFGTCPLVAVIRGVTPDEVEAVGDALFDAGIRMEESVAQDMIAFPVGGQLPLAVVAAPGYLARHEELAVPDDLRQHNCIGYRWSAAGASQAWKFEQADERAEVPVQGTLTVNDPHVALRAALDGVGVALLPREWVASHIADGRLVPLLPDWSPRWANFVLYYSSRRHVPVKLRAFADFLRREAKHAARAERPQRRKGPPRAPRFIKAPGFHGAEPVAELVA